VKIIPYTDRPVYDPTGPVAIPDLRPAKAHPTDAAYDLCAAEAVCLLPGDRQLVPTGIRVAIPEGYAGLVLPRSGLALKHGITVLNAPGLIDPGYRGEIGVILVNLDLKASDFVDVEQATGIAVEPWFNIERGDRIAQLLIVRTAEQRLVYWPPAPFERHFDNTERAESGFGSSGR
jgi:dUTP pyrophosphatase